MEENPAAAGEVQAPQTEQISTEPAQAPAQAPAPDMHGFTSEQLADIEKFFKANGGFESIKSKISNPQPVTPPTSEAPKAPVAPQAPVAPVEEKPAEGYLSAKDIAYLQYRGMLASDAKYAQLGDYINSGKFIEEMEAMGMKSVDAAGNLNDKTIRMFLDLKAQTLPAPAPSTPSNTTTPLVDYVDVGEEIKSHAEAMAVLGQTGHPRHEDAMKFLQNEIFGNKKPVEKK